MKKIKRKTVPDQTGRSEIELVHREPASHLPKDFVGRSSKYAKGYIGQLIREDGSHYSRNERRAYYSRAEIIHPAKTPLHVARWAIQTFTKEDDWVLDPTMGCGTTAVEALRLDRNVAGIEIEFIDIIRANVLAQTPYNCKCKVVPGDARDVAKFIKEGKLGTKSFDLIINNPPYSGDKREKQIGTASSCGGIDKKVSFYDKQKKNLALLNESQEYWDMIEKIYRDCSASLKPGGRFVIAVKDMMRDKKPYLLHEKLGDVLAKFLKFESMVLLKHFPGTLFLNTYEKTHGIKPPSHQVILVFKKL